MLEKKSAMLEKESAMLKKKLQKLGLGTTPPLRDRTNEVLQANRGDQLSSKVKKADDQLKRNSSKNVAAAKKKVIRILKVDTASTRPNEDIFLPPHFPDCWIEALSL